MSITPNDTPKAPFQIKKPTILAVDDNQKLTQSLRQLLETYGYNVITACGGYDAISRIESFVIDTILLDLNMPDLNGHAILKYLNEHKLKVPVIVISGEASFDSVKKALKAGAHDFIRKPYAAEELINTIQHAINHRALIQENNRMQERITHSESLHRFMVNSSPDLIYMLDAEGHFTYVNDAVNNLLNIPKERVIGRHFSYLLGRTNNYSVYLNERRTGERRTQNQEIQLQRRLSTDDNEKATLTMPFELNAMGVYDMNDGQKVLRGSYGIARDITDRKQAESVIRFQAYHDILTGLPNRSLLRDRLQTAISQAKRSGEKVVFMFIDLDRFKIINDTLGHNIGDQLLQSVARRLQSCIREGDTFARFGGDEFALVLPRITQLEDVETIAKKMIGALTEAFSIESNEIYVSASIGISAYPDNGHQIDTLIQHADIAMYDIKGSGRNGYVFFNEEMNCAYSKRLSLENDLRNALEQNQLEIYYQPLVDSRTCKLFGLEALLRWNHPEHGQLTPADFIHIAEETGMIIAIGERVLELVCTDLLYWNTTDIRAAVNFSLTQVAHPDFLSMVFNTLDKYKISPNQLEIEITENAFVSDHHHIIEKLKSLSEAGIQIAIDDFGTGYSCLSYLHQFPVNTLKMDRSFINNIQTQPRDACIVNAIIAMAKGLNLKLIAEGVETKEQHQYLCNLGCDGAQGHLFSEAVNREAANKLIGEPLHQRTLKERDVDQIQPI